MSIKLIHADCAEAMREMDDASVHAVVCDPPYGLSREPDIAEVLQHWLAGDDYAHRGGGFMGKSWDSFVPGPAVWSECLRVLKPGGHLLAFAGTRTADLMGMAIRIAGFEIRDSIMWLYGSGFPKSLDVSKAIDKRAGAEREVVGSNLNYRDPAANSIHHERWNGATMSPDITAPATSEAQQWDDWGTALKPAHEPIVVARKPLIGTVAENVLEHGTGGINIAGCKIGGGTRPLRVPKGESGDIYGAGLEGGLAAGETTDGRWPANVVLSHLEDCEQVGTRLVKGSSHDQQPTESGNAPFGGGRKDGKGYGGTDGIETVEAWDCAPGCPVAALDEQSGERKSGTAVGGLHRRSNKTANCYGHFAGERTEGDVTYGDSGGASRFFYCAKASSAERNAGLERFEPVFAPTMGNGIGGKEHDPETATRKPNIHPTVKPIDLMRWLIRLVTPPGGVVLDPFLGSGTTGCAAALEGVGMIGIERDADYLEVARARVAFWEKHQGREIEEVLGAVNRSERDRRKHSESGQMGLEMQMDLEGEAT